MPTAVKRKAGSTSKELKSSKSAKKTKTVKAAPPPPKPESESEQEDDEQDEDDEQWEDDDQGWGDEGAGEEDGDENDEDEDGDVEMEGGEKTAAKTNKTPEELEKQRLARAEQKRIAAERKTAKPLGDVIQRAKKIWEQLRRRQVSNEERQKLITELQDMVRGKIKELMFKHDASRVVQTAVKYGSKKVRQEIAEELKGTYVQLAQSSYGKYLVVKLMHYGTPETKAMVVEEFCGNVRKLIKHREASFVVEDCYREYGTKEQKARLLREFYGLEFALFQDEKDKDTELSKILERNPGKRAVIMKNLFDLISQVVNKGAFFFSIVHKAMLEFLKNTQPGTTDSTEFIELIKEHVGDVAFTKDGAQAVMRCLAQGTAKDRKVMLKSLKEVSDTLSAHESGYLVMLTAFDVVDDTVLVSKSLFPKLQENLFDLATHKFGRIPLLYPLVGRKTRLLQPSAIKHLEEMDKIRALTSKKDPEVRQSELRNHLSPIVLKGITEHMAHLVHDSFGCQFITEVLLGATGDKTPALQALTDLASASNPTLPTPSPAPDAAEPVLPFFPTTAAGGRMLKTLCSGGHYSAAAKKVELITPPLGFSAMLFDAIKEDIVDWAVSPASFVVVAMLETAEEWDGREELRKLLKKGKKKVEKAAGENKGAGVLVKMI